MADRNRLSKNSKRRLLIAGIVVGALLTASPVIGLLGAAFGMTRAFDSLGSSGIGNPEALTANISNVLYSMAAGLFLFPVGIAVFTVSLVAYLRLRASTPPPLPASQPRTPGT